MHPVQVSGNIVELNADFNTKVKKGQLVAAIDPATFQAKVDQARAQLDSANAAVVNARAQATKADSDIANSNANVANQRANVVRAQSAVADAKNKLARREEMAKQGIRQWAQAQFDAAGAARKQMFTEAIEKAFR